MSDVKKSAVAINFPKVPEKPNPSDIVVAMGRLAMAWSASEFYFGLILARLMAHADLSSSENVQKALDGSAVMTVDMNAIYALYFAVESTRGRRRLVLDLASVRVGEGYLIQASYDSIKELTEQHENIGKIRNVYAHTAMGQIDDGSYVFLNGKMMISRVDGARKQRSARIRAGNNKVQVKMIDELTDRITAWIEQASVVLNQIATSASPSPAPNEHL